MIIKKNMFIYSILTISLLSTTTFANNERINSSQDQNKANKTRIYNLRENNIDIKAPDNYGVSHNKYQHFNIGKDYITHLNNDATRNQNMINQKTGPAKIIINEITHDEITYLNGQLNVKGTPAKVVIINPNGIICNDCQFTNATEVDLVAGRMFYIDKTISYHTNKGKIIFTGKGIQSNDNFVNQKSNLLSKLSIYAGQLQLKNNANIHVAEQYYAVGNYNNYYYLDFDNKGIMAGEKIATKFTIGKGSQIYANKLTIFNGQGLNLHNQGSIITHNIMSINADHIVNEGNIMANTDIGTSRLSGMYISAKHLVNHYNGNISATRGEIGFKQTYLPFGYQDKNIKITKLTY
ncbi:filamentous hemagglutinin N-terminal domain-containing protein [Arsenophonus nasoniae]|uniref:two-partner secretion domain-containing protein n=1 Tax=Arsenophonus nasoniae TaxID=638 RepID=UPI00387A1F06